VKRSSGVSPLWAMWRPSLGSMLLRYCSIHSLLVFEYYPSFLRKCHVNNTLHIQKLTHVPPQLDWSKFAKNQILCEGFAHFDNFVAGRYGPMLRSWMQRYWQKMHLFFFGQLFILVFEDQFTRLDQFDISLLSCVFLELTKIHSLVCQLSIFLVNQKRKAVCNCNVSDKVGMTSLRCLDSNGNLTTATVHYFDYSY